MLRRQLPVRSPVAVRTLLAGLRAVVGPGPEARRQLSDALCRLYAAQEAILLDSGTAALTIGLEAAAKARPGRPVALPAYSCYDVATAALGSRAPVTLYDIDPVTLGPDLESLRRTLALQPAAVVVAHLFGFPVDVNAVQRLCDEAGALLIEDAAQGAGGMLGSAVLGTRGPLSVMSFGRGKGVTSGAGGALLARGAGQDLLRALNPDPQAPRRGAPDVGRLAMQWLLGRPAFYGVPSALPFLHLGETVFRAPSDPAEMSDAAVAMLPWALRSMEQECARRRANGLRLLAAVRGSGKLRPVEQIGDASPGFLRLPLLCLSASADRVAQQLKARGVARGYPKPLSRLPRFAEGVLNRGQGFGGADELAERLVTFPTHGLLTEGDLGALEAWVGD
jgi:dTDP-4-amino-4,6-dideoxygalactose transaminase